MDTLHIKIKDKEVYDHLMWFLGKFDETELQISEGDTGLNEIQKELQEELNRIDKGSSELTDIKTFDAELKE